MYNDLNSGKVLLEFFGRFAFIRYVSIDKILQDIIDAPPTDGLWEDGRTDKDQLGGLTYEQLEEAMTNQESEHYEDYMKLRKPNLHKMEPIPVCSMEKYR